MFVARRATTSGSEACRMRHVFQNTFVGEELRLGEVAAELLRFKYCAYHQAGSESKSFSWFPTVKEEEILAVYEAVVNTGATKTSELALAVFTNRFYYF